MEKGIVIGLMSGTSLDGLDLVAAEFNLLQLSDYKILASETIDYSSYWKQRLEKAMTLSAEDLIRLDRDLGDYFGECVKVFIAKNRLIPQLISSHGHTIFHQPEKKFTLQIGSGTCIYAITGITTVSDFRSLDVAMGGQGAPLVPIGDELLFASYDQCLNLGGIANISAKEKDRRIAFDICAFNMVLNFLSEKLHFPYDDKGKLAKQGQLNEELLYLLNQITFYSNEKPKSLGREQVEKDIFRILAGASCSVYDQLRTCTHHFAEQIAKTINHLPGKNVLVTGGGAYNEFFIEELRRLSKKEILLPDSQIINFKEALVFALLGFLRVNRRVNTLSSVTGAKYDSSGGVIQG